MTALAPATIFDPFDATPDAMAVLAPDGAVLRANSAFRARFRQWIGPGRPPWGRVRPPDFVQDQRRFDAAAPDGRRIEWIERRFPDGASLIVGRDVTERAAAEHEAARAKTVLFATLTHELRTPLNGILGMAGLLAQSHLEPAQSTYVGAIRQSGEHLLDIITEILDYARLEAGSVTLEAAPFDPEATLQSVAELLSPKAHAKGLDIAVIARAGTPSRVLGDDGRLRQIIFNLAGNAVKFTEKGGVILELSAPMEGRLRLSVSDSGPGVPPELQNRIFEEFAQADASTARLHGGAGLGLAIVKRLANAMNGDVGVTSRPGQGARFWIEAPFTFLERAPPPLLAGRKVALVSASRIVQSALVANLQALGATLTPADAAPDVLLIDGLDTFARADLEGWKASARAVIAVAPQEKRSLIDRARALGVQHYVVKPVRRRSLVERILSALDETDSAKIELPNEEEPSSDALAGARILLAEDNPINALLARTLLTRGGATVDVVGDGEEAVAAAQLAPYDLILLDLRMPRLDGFGAAARIRALPGPAAHTPLVALTADAGEEERNAALAAGMDDFITKPVDQSRLARVAARFTGRAKAGAV